MTILFCLATAAAHLLLFAAHDVQGQAVNSDSDSHINNMAIEGEEEQPHEQQQQLLQEEQQQLLQEEQQQREMVEYTRHRELDQLRQRRKEAEEAATKVDTFKNKKVKIELYYMPQCPGCRQLITSSFSEAFHTPGFSDMADVTFVSYGNAHHTKTTTNGKRIFDNVLEACALHYIGIHGDDNGGGGDAGSDATDTTTTTDTTDSTNNLLSRHKNNQHQDTQFRYIECIDQFPRSRYSRKAHQVDIDCAKALGLTNTAISSIEECAASERGHELAHRMVKQADSITPRINYYPWTLVNNVHDEDIEKGVWASLFHLVCNVYIGSERSEHCIADDDDDSGDIHEEDDIMDQL